MMVIQFGNNATAVSGIAAANATVILPADRCIWTQSANSSGGYDISAVHYADGSGAPTSLAGTGRTFELGYIGKSGRFVQISA